MRLTSLASPPHDQAAPYEDLARFLIRLAADLLYATQPRSMIPRPISYRMDRCFTISESLRAFAQKNNFIGAFLASGFGYEKVGSASRWLLHSYGFSSSQLNFFHRFAGKLVVLAANIYSLHFRAFLICFCP